MGGKALLCCWIRFANGILEMLHKQLEMSHDQERCGCCLHVMSPQGTWFFCAEVVVAKIVG
jgi:hypothetical protein